MTLLAALPFAQMGFRGNDDDYYSPDNSYINKVGSEHDWVVFSCTYICILAWWRRDGME